MIPKHKTRHYINGKDFGEPRSWQGLVIKKDFINSNEEININISDLDFVLEANTYLRKRIFDGLNGGVGIFEGEPYSIVVGEESSPIYTFDGYLDFTDNLQMIGNEEIICSLKQRKQSDWLNDVADSFSFAYLYSKGVVNSGDYTKVPYVINYIPDGVQLILLSISLYMMTKELIENTYAIAESIGDITDAVTPVIGVGVGFGAVAVTAWDLGNFILTALKLVARIIYTIAIVIAIKELIEQIFDQILPAKRDHLGMTFRKMFEKSCSYLGLTFESSITELEWVYIPKKDKKGGESGEVGYPDNESPLNTFGDLIREMKKMFNAEYSIQNGVFKFERRDKLESQSSYVIPNFFNDQDRLLDVSNFNTDEMVANYNIAFSYDIQDLNTLDDKTGRLFQAIIRPNNSINEDLVNIKGLSEVSLPYSLGKTKTSLTGVEELAKDLGSFVDRLTGIFGGGTNFANQIESRIGSMLMSSHFITNAKVVKMNGSSLARNQRGEINASMLWNNYHFINSFAEVNGVHNQFYLIDGVEVPMSLNDFAYILESNKVKDVDGNDVEIDYMEYTPHNGKAILNIRINKKYTNNLTIEYVI